MKKTLLYTLASISLLATSCQEKHEIEYTSLGSEFFISDSGITSLDTQTTISIMNEQKNLSSVELFNADLSLGDIALTDGAGSMDLTLAQLGVADIEDEVTLTGKGVIDGKPFERTHTVTVGDATSYSLTGDLVEFKADNDTLFVEVSTAYTDITSVVFKGSQNDEPLEVVTFDDETLEGTSFEGYVVIPNTLEYKDSLNGEISVTSSVRTEVKEFVLHVGGKAFDYSGAGSVSSEVEKGDSYLYVFQPLDEEGEDDGDLIKAGMISYANVSGNFAGITSTDVSFLKVGEDDEVANLSELVMFISAGTPSNTVDQVAVGERYAYTFMLDSKEHYGVITITEALTEAVGDPSYGFSYTNVSTDK